MVINVHGETVPQVPGSILHKRCNLKSKTTPNVKDLLQCVSFQDRLRGWGLSIAAASVLLMAPAAEAQKIDTRCEPNSSCVSPSAWKSPAQYMPAWSFYPSSRSAAFRQAQLVLQDLETEGKATVLEQDLDTGYLKVMVDIAYVRRLCIQMKALLIPLCHTAWHAGKPDFDIAEVWLRDDGIATFRVQSEINLPSPPGCFRKNCINGPRTRQHATWLQGQLGWLPLETDEGKAWKPLFFH